MADMKLVVLIRLAPLGTTARLLPVTQSEKPLEGLRGSARFLIRRSLWVRL